ncbi:MAG: glycosyltransferase family 4 protein [bacterium]|nr:glycosyltransferase family 4 protein [bacterium]
MKRILYINHVGKISGAERVLLNLLSHLDRAKFEPVVIAPSDGTLLSEITKLGIKTYPIKIPLLVRSYNPIRLILYIPNFWKTTAQLKTMIQKEKIDLLHANSFTAMLYSGFAAKLMHRPIIWHMHDIVTPCWFNRQFIGFAGRLATRIIAVSNAVKTRLIELGVSRDKCTVIYNGMDCLQAKQLSQEIIQKTKSKLNIPPDAIVISMFGQIAQWKGQHIFISAVKKLISRTQIPVKFLIVGDIIQERERGYKQCLEQLVKQLDLQSVVIFTGYRTDISILMQMTDIIVHSSIMPDPLPTVLFEAMLYWKPVVASNVGGVPEIVVDNETGILVPPNDVEALATAIQTLLNCPELRKIFGEQGRNRLEQHFNIQQNVAAIETCYRQLLSSPSK